jgi:hypothetical protein
MAAWLDFLQIALALGAGWLGWVLFRLTRSAPSAARPLRSARPRGAPARLTVVKAKAVDREP